MQRWSPKRLSCAWIRRFTRTCVDGHAAVILSGNQFSSEEQRMLEDLGVRLILEKSVPLPELAAQLVKFMRGS